MSLSAAPRPTYGVEFYPTRQQGDGKWDHAVIHSSEAKMPFKFSRAGCVEERACRPPGARISSVIERTVPTFYPASELIFSLVLPAHASVFLG